MSQFSKMKYSRDQWKHKAKQRGKGERYERQEKARIKAERDQITQALKASEARVRELEARLNSLATRPKVDVIHLALQPFLEARLSFRAVSRVLALLALALVQAAYQPRFRYTAMGLARGMGAGVRVVEFREYQRPTVLRAGIGDLLTSGLVWMDEQSGRVVKTELDIHTQPRASRVVTTFTIDPVLGIDVPSEMEGRYFGQGEETITRARYSGFRKFSVQTQETFR